MFLPLGIDRASFDYSVLGGPAAYIDTSGVPCGSLVVAVFASGSESVAPAKVLADRARRKRAVARLARPGKVPDRRTWRRHRQVRVAVRVGGWARKMARRQEFLNHMAKRGIVYWGGRWQTG